MRAQAPTLKFSPMLVPRLTVRNSTQFSSVQPRCQDCIEQTAHYPDEQNCEKRRNALLSADSLVTVKETPTRQICETLKFVHSGIRIETRMLRPKDRKENELPRCIVATADKTDPTSRFPKTENL